MLSLSIALALSNVVWSHRISEPPLLLTSGLSAANRPQGMGRFRLSMDNPTLIPLHDLVLDGRTFEYPVNSSSNTGSAAPVARKYYVTGHFYLGGRTIDVKSLKRRLRWYYLDLLGTPATSVQTVSFDPSANWTEISDNKKFDKHLTARKMPWIADQGTRIDFCIQVPSFSDCFQLAVALAGSNKNPDSPKDAKIGEESLVMTEFSVKINGIPQTDNFVPVTIDYPWSYQNSDRKRHLLFSYSTTAVTLKGNFQVFASQSTRKDFPGLGPTWKALDPSQYSVVKAGPNKHTHFVDVQKSAGSFILMTAGDTTKTPEAADFEFSAVIRENN